MYHAIVTRNEQRRKRVLRVRKRVRGSSEKPRLSVFKSNRHLFAQVIDDERHATILSLGTMQEELKGALKGKKSVEIAKILGEKIAQAAKSKGIESVVFDRGRYKYHGVVAQLAEGARGAGLKF